MGSKMSKENRAKQFMPFAALKGHMEALKRREKIVVPRKELSESYQEELDWTLRQLQVKDVATVIYYHKGEYIRVTGMVSKIDRTARFLKIVDKKIFFDSLYQVSFESMEKR